jgi:hypothetical protein
MLRLLFARHPLAVVEKGIFSMPMVATQPILALDVAEAFYRRCEFSFSAQLAALIIFGLPLSLLGPLLITVIVLANSANHHVEFHFLAKFVTICMVSLPFFFVIAATLPGSILEANAEMFHGHTRMSRRTVGKAAAPLLIIEICNIGPRMIVYAYKRFRARELSGTASAERVAQAISTLASSDGGIAPVKLMLPGDSPELFQSLLAILFFYEIADSSESGDRIWMMSDVKSKLMPDWQP